MFFRLLELSLNSDSNKFWTFLQRAVVGLSALFIFILIKSNNGGAAGAEFLLFHFKIVYVVASLVCLISFAEIVGDYREDETLALLLMTGVPIPKLLMSIFAGKLVLLLSTILVQVPFCLYAVTLGGVTTDMVINLFISSSIWLFFMACLGALLSAAFSTKNESCLAGCCIFAAVFIILDFFSFSPLQSLNDLVVNTKLNYSFSYEIIWFILGLGFLAVLLINFEKYYFSPIKYLDEHLEKYRNMPTTSNGRLKQMPASEYRRFKQKLSKTEDRKTIRFKEKPIIEKDRFLHPWNENSNIYDFLGTFNTRFSTYAIILVIALVIYLTFRFDTSPILLNAPLFAFMIFAIWLKTFKAFKAEIDEETLSNLLVLPMSNKELLNSKLTYIKAQSNSLVWFYFLACFMALIPSLINWELKFTGFLLAVFCLPILKKSVDYLTLWIIFIDRHSSGLSAGTVSVFAALSFFIFPAFSIPVMIVFLLLAKKLLLNSIEHYAASC
jgi:hypothetical protein